MARLAALERRSMWLKISHVGSKEDNATVSCLP